MLEKTFDPKSVEPRLYAAWEASGAFKPSEDPNAEPFVLPGATHYDILASPLFVPAVNGFLGGAAQ